MSLVLFGDYVSYYEFPSGITFPAVFALLAHLYSKKYDISLDKLKEQMATTSIQAYKYGMLNPRR